MITAGAYASGSMTICPIDSSSHFCLNGYSDAKESFSSSAIADVLLGNEPEEVSIDRIQRQSLNVLFLSLLLAFSAARALGQCAGKVSSPAAVADCAARETPREGTAILDPAHPYTLAELIDVAEHHNPSTRTIWERAKQKARELGLAKAAYYPELEGLAVFGDERLINPFPKPLAPRGYVMVEIPIVRA